MRFLDRLEGNKHIAMLYDDERNADLIIGRYFLNGFGKGHSCVFFTDENPDAIKRRLSAQEIDVDRYERENRLRIFHVESSDSGKTDVLKTLKATGAEMSKGMKRPFRFVGRTITDIESVGGCL